MADSDKIPVSMYTKYLNERGYQAVKIPEATISTPDLEVSGRGHSYLNEVKSPDLQLDPALGLYKFTTTSSKLLQLAHKAIKQLRVHDPSHGKPWVVTFTSVNMQLNWHTLVEVMQGGIVVEGKVIENWTRAKVFERWTEDRYAADYTSGFRLTTRCSPTKHPFLPMSAHPTAY